MMIRRLATSGAARARLSLSTGITSDLLMTRRFSSKDSVAMIKKLRDLSGAPMMDCKQALAAENVHGDIQKALHWLRAKGISKAANSDRATNEGLIGLHEKEGGRLISLVEVNCETGFVIFNNTDAFTNCL